VTSHAKSKSTEHPPEEAPVSSAAPLDLAGITAAHSLYAEEVLHRLAVVQEHGLSSEGAASRLADFGPNQLPEPERDSAFIRFFRHFQDVLIYVLIGAGILAAALQHWADTIVIALVVVINALVGFLQEGRSERALAGIRSMLSPSADVLRAGEQDRLVDGRAAHPAASCIRLCSADARGLRHHTAESLLPAHHGDCRSDGIPADRGVEAAALRGVAPTRVLKTRPDSQHEEPATVPLPVAVQRR